MQSSRPTYLEVNLGQLKRNLLSIKSHVHPAKVMILLKANAYGHGVDEVATQLAPLADYVGVAFVAEGVRLRELGISRPIMVLGGTLEAELPTLIEHSLTISISSMELLEAAERTASSLGVKPKAHLKIDTGMERTGVHDYDSGAFLERALECRHIQIEGIYTHFANSEARDLGHARLQLARFEEVLQFYERRDVDPPALRHAANSGAILQLPDSHFDMVRAGLLLYGIYPGPETARSIEVQPAMRWISTVVYAKTTLPHRPVSYGSLWNPDRPCRVLTIPCGYGDGYFRRMTNQARVLVNGRSYAQVGRICMDHFMVNAADDAVQVGDEVVLLGRDSHGQSITAEDLAAWAGTSPYEVLTNIGARVPRRFINDD